MAIGIRRSLFVTPSVQNTLSGSTTLSSTVSLCTVGAVVAGSTGLTKGGPGLVIISATPTYTGTTTINGGTLAYGIFPPGSGAGAYPPANPLVLNGSCTFLQEGAASSIVMPTGGITCTGSGNNVPNFLCTDTGNSLFNFNSATTYNYPSSGTFGLFSMSCAGSGATTRGIQSSASGRTLINVTAQQIYMNGCVGGKATADLFCALWDTSAVNGPQTHLCAFGKATTNVGVTTYICNAGTGTLTIGDCTAVAGTLFGASATVNQIATFNCGTLNYSATNNISTGNTLTMFVNSSSQSNISSSLWSSTASTLTNVCFVGSGTHNLTAANTAGNTGQFCTISGGVVNTTGGSITGGAGSSILVGIGGGSITASGGASGQNVINTASTTNVVIGQRITGTGIPAGVPTFVASFVANTSVTISTNLTATASGTYTFTGGSGGINGTGTIATSSVTLATGNYVQGGSSNTSPGTLTLAALTTAGGSINVGTNGTTTVSTVALTGTLNVSGGCVVNLLNTISAAGTYTLTTGATSLTGTSGNVSLGTNSSGRTFSSFQFSGNNLQVVLT